MLRAAQAVLAARNWACSAPEPSVKHSAAARSRHDTAEDSVASAALAHSSLLFEPAAVVGDTVELVARRDRLRGFRDTSLGSLSDGIAR